MKNKLLILVAALTPVLGGCKYAQQAGNFVGKKLYTPIVATNTVPTEVTRRVPEVITLEDGTTHTNFVEKVFEVPVEVVSTNGWTLNPSIESGIHVAGDVAPFPWAGLAANLLVGALGLGAHLKGRKWKKAAVEGVQFGFETREKLKKYSAEEAEEVKRNAVTRQRSSGVKGLIEKVLAEVK